MAALFLTSASARASSIIDVAGTTTGCFGDGCSVYTDSSASDPVYSLTFTGTSFDVDTDATGSASSFTLGTLARGRVNVSDSEPDLPFTLMVTFTLPSGMTGGQDETFSALITATNSGGGGPLDVDFDNAWQTLTYSNVFGTGAFEFSVISDLDLTKNGSGSILGGVRNATFSPVTQPDPEPGDVTVPEPATILLCGIGLATAAYRRRRLEP